MVTGVEQNGVRGLGADSPYAEKFLAQLRGGRAKHLVEGSGVFCAQELHEGLQLPGLLPEIAGGTNQSRQASRRNAFDCLRRHHLLALEVIQGALNIGPSRVLSKYRSDNHFKS